MKFRININEASSVKKVLKEFTKPMSDNGSGLYSVDAETYNKQDDILTDIHRVLLKNGFKYHGNKPNSEYSTYENYTKGAESYVLYVEKGSKSAFVFLQT